MDRPNRGRYSFQLTREKEGKAIMEIYVHNDFTLMITGMKTNTFFVKSKFGFKMI